MNDKLKQSLEGRLCGMRWGEREQAEVFRQIQRKELQDVKHVKRSTGMLAVAIAMLFIVMGAAFALTQNGQPADSRIAGQTAEPTFIPVPMAQYENEYFTLTIDSTAFTGKSASFIATIRLKDPDNHMLMLAGHTPPGDPRRTPLTITPSAQFTVRLANGVPLSCGSLTDGLDVLSMTSSAATFRMAGDMQYANSVTAITLWMSYTEPVHGAGLCAEITIPLARTEPAVAPAAEPLLENKFITVRMTESRIEGTQATIGLDVTPSKSWYALNSTADDKATLTIHLEPMLVYSCSNREELLTLVDYRAPTLGEMAFSVEATPEGLYCTAQGELPAGHDSLLGYVVVSIYSEAAVAHDDTSDVHYAEVIVPLPIPQAAVTPSPAPQPVVTPTPERSTPTGKHVGGTERVSVYLEDIWYDGFCAEATLRIRADDAADRLATTPNANGVPSENTWVVKLEGSWNDYYRSVITPTLTLEPDTGDVLVQLSYENLHDGESSNFYLPITLTVTNEKTWEAETDDISLRPEISGTYVPQPLYLVSSSMDNLFLQGSLLTTDRYHYVGVMISPDAAHVPIGHLLDENGAEIAEGHYTSVNGKSLKTFPRTLFPYDGDDQSQFHLIVIRVDKTVTLADPLPVHLTKWTQKEGYTDLADMTLSTTPPAPSAAHQQVSIVLDKNVLFDNEHVTVAFIDADYGYGHAFAHLNAALKDTANYTTVAEGHTETHLDIQLSFAEYSAGQAASPVAFTALTDSDDSWKRSFYLHGYSESWTTAQPPVVLARLSLQSEDGSICEEYTAVFTFPASGEVRLYSMAPAEEEYRPYFSYAGGQLADTDYLSALSLQYTCDSSVDQASCSVHARSYPVEPSHQEDRLLELIDSETQKRQLDVLCPYLYFDSDNLQIPWFTLFVRDAVHNHLLAEIPILLTPIAD